MPESTLSGFHVAVTRPIAQSTKLCDLIKSHGGQTISFPLIEIVPLDDYDDFDQKLLTLDNYDLAIFISSNAVNQGMPRLLTHLKKIPPTLQFAAIGPATASELQKFGVQNILAPENRFDSESLLALPAMLKVNAKRIIIFRGIGGREILANTLRSRGATVDFAECYQRINPQTNADVLSGLWQNKQLQAIVVTSSEAMRHLLDIAGQGEADWIKNVTLCVNHARIAELLLETGLKVMIAEAPGDAAMLQCLIEAATHSNT